MNNALLTAKLETVDYSLVSEQQDAFAKVMGTIYNPYSKEGRQNAFSIHFIAYKNNAEILREHSNQICIIEGRIGITTSENPSGYKEKAAHMVVERIMPLSIRSSTQSVPESSNPQDANDILF